MGDKERDKALKIAKKMMYDNDAFSQWLDIKIIDVVPGKCTLSMKITPEMTNGFYIAHGGIAFSLADSAVAFAANAYGNHALSIENSISYFSALELGEEIMVVAEEIKSTKSFAWYQANILNLEGVKKAHFKATIYKKKTLWEI